jgi:hypothetical protein
MGPDALGVREKGHELDPQVGVGNVRSGSVLMQVATSWLCGRRRRESSSVNCAPLQSSR